MGCCDCPCVVAFWPDPMEDTVACDDDSVAAGVADTNEKEPNYDGDLDFAVDVERKS